MTQTTRAPVEMILAKRIRQLREERGWTLRQLGTRAGVGWSTVWGLERCTRSASLATVQALADAFEVAPPDLITPVRSP